MRLGRVMAVFRREYMTRVRTRGFWVATALIPLFMVAITVLPSLFAMRQQGTITLGIQDHTGRILEPLTDRVETTFGSGESRSMILIELSTGLDDDALAERVESREIDAYVVITDEAIEDGRVNYFGQVTTNIIFQDRLEDVFADVFTADRLRIRGYDPEEIELLTTRVRINPVGIGDEGAASGEIRFIMAYGMFFTLYMMLMLYGQNIMRGVLEEKTSRIVEIVVSSLKPKELLVGKVLGIGAVGFTQLGIWLLTLLLLSGTAGVGMIAALSAMPAIPILHILNFLCLFILGFLVYAILFAAVGSIHNNEQEAQQYNTVVMMPIIIPVIFIFSVINAPNSTMSVVLSFIPLFSPLIMVARVAVGAVPAWQIAVAYTILIAFIAFEVAFVSRIYRVGILMYGKRPSLPEVMKWMRY